MRLGELTMSQYIGIVCGDLKPLGKSEDPATERSKLMSEYSAIADPTGTSARLGRSADNERDKATLLLFLVCSNLLLIGGHAEVREILCQYGIKAEGMTDEQVTAEVKSRMARAKSLVGRAEKEMLERQAEAAAPRGEDEIRLAFDRQAASLMAYFKFQIDLDTVKATQFACLVAQADREMRAKRSALEHKR